MRTEYSVDALVTVVSVSLLACSARSGSNLQPPAEHCATTLPEAKLDFGQAEDDAPHLSRVIVTARVASKRLRSEIESQVPSVLAQEKNRPIGAPGRVTYVVRLGSLAPTLHDGKLRVTATALADISVCKPLGPFCVGYGSCQPSFVSTVDVPLRLGEDYAWQRPHAAVEVARGCRIAGFDATARLRSIAESNLGSVENKIASSLPALRPGLEQAWRLFSMPVYLNKDWCLHVAPRGLVQGPARLANDEFQLSAALDAELVMEQNCTRTSEKSELPPLASADTLPETGTVFLSQLLTTERIEKQLSERLLGDGVAGESVTHVEVKTARFETGDALLVGLDLDGKTCGTAWFRVTPEAIAADRLKLTQVVSLAKTPEDTMQALRERIAHAAVLKPDLAFSSVRTEIENLVNGLSQGLTGDVKVELTFGTPQASAPDVVPRGLELWSSLKLGAVAKLE